MSLKTISAAEAKKLIEQGAQLIDVRGADEHARERIPGARLEPLNTLSTLPADTGPLVIFHCRSGGRTAANASRLKDAAACEAYILEGGIEAWKAAGLPVVADKSQPIEVMRQVQITAGSLVLAGVLLGHLVNPMFYGLAGFIGAGLVFAGATGWCGMAQLLSLMPWNRRTAAGPSAA